MNKKKILNFIKKNYEIIIISILVIITLTLSKTYVYKNQTKNNIWNEEIRLSKISPSPISTPILTPVPSAITIPLSCEKLIEEDSQLINNLYDEEPKNFFWLNENEKIEYIKGFSIYMENKELKKYYQKCLEENFILSDQNNLKSEYSFSYQKNNFKCHLTNFDLTCGSQEQNDENAQVILTLYKQNHSQKKDFEATETIKIIKKNNDLMDVAIGNSGGGIRILMKWEDNNWKSLKASQEGWFCEDMEKYNLPAYFFEKNICYSHEEQTYYKYNETTKKWELTNERPY